MKNKRSKIFLSGILALVLVFGSILIGCPNETSGSDEGDKMPNELGGKTYVLSVDKWEFNSNGTYKKYSGTGENIIIWEEYVNGVYTWNTDAKTVTLSPQKVIANDGLLNKTEYCAYLEEAYGEDGEYIQDQFGMTVEQYINELVDKAFAPQTYTYNVEGGKIVSLKIK